MVDDDEFDGGFSGNQLQAELLLQRSEEPGSGGV